MADKGACFGVFLVTVSVILVGLPFIVPLPDPLQGDLDAGLVAPFTSGHLLGTDQLGRDLLSRIVWGVRPALVQGVVSVSVATILGIIVGSAAGYFGGLLDSLTMRLVDSLLAIPPLMMAIAVSASLGPGLRNMVFAMTLVMIAPMARVAHGSTVEQKEQLYVVGARSVGVPNSSILLRHIIPNAVTPVIAYAMPLIGIMIVFGAGLSFVGLGVQPPTADWGRMVSEGRMVLGTAPYVATFPGLAIFMLGLGFNLLGDWLQAVLNPRSRT